MDQTEVLASYRILPYRRTVERIIDEDGTYFVCRYPELPGLSADGMSPAEARRNAALAFDDYILAQLEWGLEIPRPTGADRVVNALIQLEDAKRQNALKWVELAEAGTASAASPQLKDESRAEIKAVVEAEGRSGSTTPSRWLHPATRVVERRDGFS